VKSFAGFWRDGAVVKPEGEQCEKRHFVGIFKDSEQYALISRSFSQWHQVYWLDTTTPTELSPQEAFELLKVINPDAERLEDDGGDWVLVEPGSDIINWGNATEYPPKHRWRVPTDADKGKKCRVSNDNDCFFMELTFIATFNGIYIVANSEHKISCWDYCEVQDET
jgi:hypothetical protein